MHLCKNSRKPVQFQSKWNYIFIIFFKLSMKQLQLIASKLNFSAFLQKVLPMRYCCLKEKVETSFV